VDGGAGRSHHRPRRRQDRRARHARRPDRARWPVRPVAPAAILRLKERALRSRLERLWYGDRAGVPYLAPLPGIYGTITDARRRAYAAGLLRQQRLTRPVVVVGNLTVGGTGKTPLTIYVARPLSAETLRVGVVSRGYGRRRGAQRDAHPDSDWRDVGDEPVIIVRRTGCPTLVANDRVAAARTLIARGADVIVADDGLQHLALGRDCAIAGIDGGRGF